MYLNIVYENMMVVQIFDNPWICTVVCSFYFGRF